MACSILENNKKREKEKKGPRRKKTLPNNKPMQKRVREQVKINGKGITEGGAAQKKKIESGSPSGVEKSLKGKKTEDSPRGRARSLLCNL